MNTLGFTAREFITGSPSLDFPSGGESQSEAHPDRVPMVPIRRMALVKSCAFILYLLGVSFLVTKRGGGMGKLRGLFSNAGAS